MLSDERLKALSKIVGDEQAQIVSDLHTKHDGEIAMVIKRGKAYVTKKPSYADVQRYNQTNEKKGVDSFEVALWFVKSHLVHPSKEEAETGLNGNAIMVADLAGKTLALTAADEEFDLGGN